MKTKVCPAYWDTLCFQFFRPTNFGTCENFVWRDQAEGSGGSILEHLAGRGYPKPSDGENIELSCPRIGKRNRTWTGGHSCTAALYPIEGAVSKRISSHACLGEWQDKQGNKPQQVARCAPANLHDQPRCFPQPRALVAGTAAGYVRCSARVYWQAQPRSPAAVKRPCQPTKEDAN